MKRPYHIVLFGLVSISPMSVASAAFAICLSVENDGFASYWINSCDRVVSVNWGDQGYCDNWSCSDRIGPYQNSTASITGLVNWCEAYDGDIPRGPC
jgi:hypothetical protein